MKHRRAGLDRVLSFIPSARGLGYAIFEGPASPVDWGVSRIALAKRREVLDRVEVLVSWYRPDVLVVENFDGDRSVRRRLARNLSRDIESIGNAREIRVSSYSREMIRQCFSQLFQATTKAEIAEAIAKELPDLAHRRPPKRQLWSSQDARMSVFDAAALAVTHFYAENTRPSNR